MSEMVDRLAEAICDAAFDCGVEDLPFPKCLVVARAVLEVMREPTAAMKRAAGDMQDEAVASSGGTEQNPCPIHPEGDDYWRAMIDEALKD